VIVTAALVRPSTTFTREALAEFTGVDCREQPEALAEMERRFKMPRDQLRPNLRARPWCRSRTYLKSPSEPQSGLSSSGRKDHRRIAGAARELQPMLRDELVPYLAR